MSEPITLQDIEDLLNEARTDLRPFRDCPDCGSRTYREADIADGFCYRCRKVTGRPDALTIDTTQTKENAA